MGTKEDHAARYKLRMEALWWANEQPDYWVLTSGPGHPTNPDNKFGITIHFNTGDTEDGMLGEILFETRCDTMGQVLDQLAAWRVEQRLAV